MGGGERIESAAVKWVTRLLGENFLRCVRQMMKELLCFGVYLYILKYNVQNKRKNENYLADSEWCVWTWIGEWETIVLNVCVTQPIFKICCLSLSSVNRWWFILYRTVFSNPYEMPIIYYFFITWALLSVYFGEKDWTLEFSRNLALQMQFSHTCRWNI